MAGGFAGVGGSDVSSVGVRFGAGFLLPTVWGFLSFRSGATDCPVWMEGSLEDSFLDDSFEGAGSPEVPPVAQLASSGSMRLINSIRAKRWKQNVVIGAVPSPWRKLMIRQTEKQYNVSDWRFRRQADRFLDSYSTRSTAAWRLVTLSSGL